MDGVILPSAANKQLPTYKGDLIMPGPKTAAQRSKTNKRLRGAAEKKFRNDSQESRAKYAIKINARRARKLKKNK